MSPQLDQAGCSVDTHREGAPVVKSGINYQCLRSTSRVSLTKLLAMFAIVQLSCYSLAMSAPTSRHVRSTPNLAVVLYNLSVAHRSTYDDLYDCLIDDGEICVLQNFREKRFVDPTAEPANVDIPNLPQPFSYNEIFNSSLHVLVPKMHRQLRLYLLAFQRLKADEEHVAQNESNFISEFNEAEVGIRVMLAFTKQYMTTHGFNILDFDGVPDFKATTNSLVFSPRTLHVLLQFKKILLKLETVLERL